MPGVVPLYGWLGLTRDELVGALWVAAALVLVCGGLIVLQFA